MPARLLQPLPEPVPDHEIAAVLAKAALNAAGGALSRQTALFVATLAGEHLAAALLQAGFKVVRDTQQGRQLTL